MQTRLEAPAQEPRNVEGRPGEIHLAGVSRAYARRDGSRVPALAGVDLDVAAGETVAVVGPSGCGKTTLLELVCGLTAPDAGTVRAAPAVLMPQRDLLLPWLTLATLYIGLYGRVLRANLVEAGQEDFIRTARSKGLSETRILLRHALRTSLISVVTMFGLDFGALVGGSALLTEVVFALQGVGKLTYDALQNLDLPVIMATVMYASFFVVMANALVDILYATLDPRVRLA